MQQRNLTICNKLGLHARAAARFVSLASGFDCRIMLERNGRRVNGKSIMGVMMLAAAQGAAITLITDGQDEQQAADALQQLIEDRFGEDE